LTDAQLRRALGGLSTRGLIAHRNAYLGRGIKLLDETPVHELRIDAKELAARAAAEKWKLRKMIEFAYNKACLRRFILNYFGDRKRIEHCGTCSRCSPDAAIEVRGRTKKQLAASGTLTIAGAGGSARSPKLPEASELDHFIIDQALTGSELRADLKRRAELKRALSTAAVEPEPGGVRSLNDAETIVVKKVLSCVARMNGRFGKGTIASVLRGSRSKQVIEHHLDKISTYGLLRVMTQEEITNYIKALIEAGCIVVGRGAYPTVSLTDYGREVMTGRAEVQLELC
jgi:superfamily II DNA helicase RecQ